MMSQSQTLEQKDPYKKIYQFLSGLSEFTWGSISDYLQIYQLDYDSSQNSLWEDLHLLFTFRPHIEQFNQSHQKVQFLLKFLHTYLDGVIKIKGRKAQQLLQRMTLKLVKLDKQIITEHMSRNQKFDFDANGQYIPLPIDLKAQTLFDIMCLAEDL